MPWHRKMEAELGLRETAMLGLRRRQALEIESAHISPPDIQNMYNIHCIWYIFILQLYIYISNHIYLRLCL